MKKPAIFFFVVMITVYLSTSVYSQDLKIAGKSLQDSSVSYKDGIYEGISRAKYVNEPYWGSVHLTLKNDLFTEISFVIRDSNLHETFDENYEKHFEGNPVYIQQSRNDWKGVQTYLKELKRTQDIDKINAISGATWSFNIFRASVNKALENAK
ncbi:MAG: FMN-binding protein [Bacteroidales bacterium]|jgi:uncharacterized protein with FMN-binding domain